MRIKRPYFWTGVGIVLGTAFAIAAFFYFVVAYTSDAYVRANWTVMMPQVEGYLTQIAVATDQVVKKGDLLAVIDKVPYQLKVDRAQADLARKQAELEVLRNELATTKVQEKDIAIKYQATLKRKERYDKLQLEKAVSVDAYDKVVIQEQQILDQLEVLRGSIVTIGSQIDAQRKIIELAKAELALAEYYLSQCELRAPSDGVITNLYIRPGQYVKVGDRLFGVVESKPFWIEANYKECFVGMIKPGQTVWVTTDLYPFTVFKGRVKSIIRGVNRWSIPEETLPYISPTIDWIRLQYRFRVIIDLEDAPDDLILRMGADARTMIFLN